MASRDAFTTRPMTPKTGAQHYECVIRFRYTATEDDHQDFPYWVKDLIEAGEAVTHVSDPSITRLIPERD